MDTYVSTDTHVVKDFHGCFVKTPVCERDNLVSVATVADRLQELLTERGLTARGLSLAAGLSSNAVQKILERGGGGRGDSITKLAHALRVHEAWLLSGTGPRDVEGFTKASEPEALEEPTAPESHIDWHKLRMRGEKRAQRESLDIESWAWDEFERLGPKYALEGQTVVSVAGAIRVAQGFSDAGIGRPVRSTRVATGPQSAARTGTKG